MDSHRSKHIRDAPDSCVVHVRNTVWSLFIAPTVLRHHFPEDHYYNHFCSLIRILNLCLQFEISENDIDEIKSGICKWVVDYEWCVHPFHFLKSEG